VTARLRDLPSTDRLLGTRASVGLIATYGRPLTVAALRATLDEVRSNVRAGTAGKIPVNADLVTRTASLLARWTAPPLQPVINATGVILHTNLGRAPLSGAATRAVVEALNGYSTLEYDLERGGRGSRLDRVEGILQRLTGAEGAVVVNNNAAALLLLLATLAKGKRVVVSRTQLVEIGGGFRVPDVMRQSGARMTEIGTTNRVHLQDYQRATEEPTALVLVAHRSNFRLVGFTEEPGLAEIVQLCKLRGVPLVYDLGSGALLDTAKYGLAHEPMVQEALRAGVDLVAFSADKLLGGPQAGIILGKAELVSAIKRHPMARALRADKTCLAALGATLVHYLRGEAAEQIPVWRMVALKPRQLRQRAEAMRRDLGKGEVIRGESAVGGGSLPGDTLPTYLLALPQSSPEKLMQALRFQSPPIIARTKDNRVLIDPRTILPGQEEMLLAGVRKALQEVAP